APRCTAPSTFGRGIAVPHDLGERSRARPRTDDAEPGARVARPTSYATLVRRDALSRAIDLRYSRPALSPWCLAAPGESAPRVAARVDGCRRSRTAVGSAPRVYRPHARAVSAQ